MKGPAGSCTQCLRRSWLLVRLAAHLERARARVLELLCLNDEELIAAVGGNSSHELHSELLAFDPEVQRVKMDQTGIASVCRHQSAYPQPLTELAAPPAALFVAGDLDLLPRLLDSPRVAIVGSRRAGNYALRTAASLARELSGAGLVVISGLARGVDTAAHRGSLGETGGTIAVLAAGPERAYPAANRPLYSRIRREGLILSELPPGSAAWRWAFPARNRIIAALASLTVVVDAAERSGALITARMAGELGRVVGAVPGPVGSPGAWGPNSLLAEGALVVRDGQDVLDGLFGPGGRRLGAAVRPALAVREELLLERIGAGHGAERAVAQAGFSPEEGLAALAALELDGYLRRAAGGGFTRAA